MNFVMGGAAPAVLVGAILSLVMEPMFGGVAVMLAGGVAFIWAHNRTKMRNELEIYQLVAEPNETLERNLRALEEFRNLIGSGDILCEERLPDGTIKPLSQRVCQAFLADHGALLILSRDQGRVAHVNAGIYVPFEKFLATMPLHDFP